MPVSENKELAEWVEQRRADKRSAEHAPNAAFYDLDAAGTLVEVKTTTRTVVNPAGNQKGCYQIEEANHDRLLDDGGVYDFVLRNGDDEIVDVTTMPASDFDELVDENNREWPSGSKLKVRYDVIHGESP